MALDKALGDLDVAIRLGFREEEGMTFRRDDSLIDFPKSRLTKLNLPWANGCKSDNGAISKPTPRRALVGSKAESL